MVEFVDGSVIAQLSPPDMKLPIQYALVLARAARGRGGEAGLGPGDGVAVSSRPTSSGSRALELGLERRPGGGTAGAVLNGANEAAVAAFLAGRLGFQRNRARLPQRPGKS